MNAEAPAPTRETVVATLLARYPAAARVFLARRMACVGCSLAAFETVADAAREYRLPLAELVAELAHATKAPPPHA